MREYDSDVPAKHGRRHRYKILNNRRIRITFDIIGPDVYFVWAVTANEVNA